MTVSRVNIYDVDVILWVNANHDVFLGRRLYLADCTQQYVTGTGHVWGYKKNSNDFFENTFCL